MIVIAYDVVWHMSKRQKKYGEIGEKSRICSIIIMSDLNASDYNLIWTWFDAKCKMKTIMFSIMFSFLQKTSGWSINILWNIL